MINKMINKVINMPIYEYKCQNEKCGCIQEVIKKINDKIEEHIECEKCGFWTYRMISKSNFILSERGKVGWCKDGYKSKKLKE